MPRTMNSANIFWGQALSDNINLVHHLTLTLWPKLTPSWGIFIYLKGKWILKDSNVYVHVFFAVVLFFCGVIFLLYIWETLDSKHNIYTVSRDAGDIQQSVLLNVDSLSGPQRQTKLNLFAALSMYRDSFTFPCTL